MANSHFAKLADVWKHLPLVDVLAQERPGLYWETHAGSGAYPMVDDSERRFGALGFSELAGRSGVLAASRYLHHLRGINGGYQLQIYPGSAVLAMSELGTRAAGYVLCDVDPVSAADLRVWADRLGLSDRVAVVPADGMATLHDRLEEAPGRSWSTSTPSTHGRRARRGCRPWTWRPRSR